MFKKWYDYWEPIYRQLKGIHSFGIFIIAVILLIFSFAYWYFNGTDTVADKWIEAIFFGLAIILFLAGITWLPVMQHQETAIKHNQEIGNLKLIHSKELAMLNGEIKLLKDEIDKNSQVNVSSAMVMENAFDLLGRPHINQKSVIIKVINNTDKIIRVDKVVIQLVPAVETENGIPAIRADRYVQAYPVNAMQIQPHGDALKWECSINQNIEINTHQKGDEFYGKGLVILLDGKQFDFEFKII